MTQQNISFAGAGRVASALCKEIYDKGFNVELIVSTTESHGRQLAGTINAAWSADLQFPPSTDIILVAVPDKELKNVLDKIICGPDTLVAHTAGSMGLDIFPLNISRKGVLYPLQTFTLGRKTEFTDLPFLLEASDPETYNILENLAAAIGGTPYPVDTQHRRLLHLAAVFISNFTNHMLTEGKNIATGAGFSFDLFLPLLKETISKAIELGPERSQTGPAVRNDGNTIEKHLELLSYSPEMKRMYNEITLSIIKYYNK